MNKTIVTIYDDIVVARQVVEDLVNAGFARNSISLITNDANNQYSHYLDKDYTARNDAVTGGEGAGFGAVIGGLTGVLVGLAALTIPGIGLAIAAGPIVAGLTGIVAGAVTGGIAGVLIKSGVPEDDAPYYAEGIRRGGTLVSIETSNTLRAQDILNRHGSINIHERVNVWRQSGWKGFETEENEPTDKPSPDVLPSVTTDETIMRNAQTPHNNAQVSAQPVYKVMNEKPQIELEDTAKSLPVIVSVPTPETVILGAPVPNELTAEPVLVLTEKETQIANEDTAK
jgi:hypothetical protein